MALDQTDFYAYSQLQSVACEPHQWCELRGYQVVTSNHICNKYQLPWLLGYDVTSWLSWLQAVAPQLVCLMVSMVTGSWLYNRRTCLVCVLIL